MLLNALQTNKMTFETITGSQDSFNLNATANNTFASNLTMKLQNAILKHTGSQNSWMKQVQKLKLARNKDDINLSQAKRALQKKLSKSSLGSLIERQ